MDDARDVTQDSQDDVDKEVGTAAALGEDTDWWDNDRKNNLDDIAA